MIAQPNTILNAVIAAETAKAMRAGVAPNVVIATLVHHAEQLQTALPLIVRLLDAERPPK